MLAHTRLLDKLLQVEERYRGLRYEMLADIPVDYMETRSHFREEPRGRGIKWKEARKGLKWGGEWVTAWFRGNVRVPSAAAGRKLFLHHVTEVETLCLADGQAKGLFWALNPVILLSPRGGAGQRIHVALEAYAGHYNPGFRPGNPVKHVAPRGRTFSGVSLALERELVAGFVLDCQVLRQLWGILEDSTLRKGQLTALFEHVLTTVPALPEEVGEAEWRPALEQARKLMKPALAAKNGSVAPHIGLVAHSHLDSAWLWTLEETRRKCARTFSALLNHLERYPEAVFIQSSPYHAWTTRDDYPEVFARVRKMVRKGRWEPNGAMWVEPDCNVPSGESFARQLLLGQSATREMFGYTADTFWVPDTFGFSAALPQILRLGGVNYASTSKLSWNDTTRFPYDTFRWRGIDGSQVLMHFVPIMTAPDPHLLQDTWKRVQHPDVQDCALLPFGFGDGGGGPLVDSFEVAKRVKDLQGCPRTAFTNVSSFMSGLAARQDRLPVWSGELYFELHRGTLTTLAKIKRNNRKAELALRDAEFVNTLAALEGRAYPVTALREAWRTLLTRQFHDILPGTSIREVHREAETAVEGCIAEAVRQRNQALDCLSGKSGRGGRKMSPLLMNTLSWDRAGVLALEGVQEGLRPADEAVTAQWVRNLDDQPLLLVSGLTVPALGGRRLQLEAGSPVGPSPFVVDGEFIETPLLRIRMQDDGRIVSCIDKRAGRELVAKGGSLNGLLTGEDVPHHWDNWDLDADHQSKLRADGRLKRREVVANGPLQLRVRSEYGIGRRSTLRQDMVLNADSLQIAFENVLDWKEKHVILKAGFDLNLLAETARHEIQFGHIERPTHRNQPEDRARFEVCAHKWSDLSESGYGAALLNDCKYGLSVHQNTMRLSLMRSPSRPDLESDQGMHRFSYALLPHEGGFCVEKVVRPAYAFNVPLLVHGAATVRDVASFLTVDAPNVVVESVKWAESGKAFVVRLYEAEKNAVKTRIRFAHRVKAVSEVNLLEEEPKRVRIAAGSVTVEFRAFEIKTLRCEV